VLVCATDATVKLTRTATIAGTTVRQPMVFESLAWVISSPPSSQLKPKQSFAVMPVMRQS